MGLFVNFHDNRIITSKSLAKELGLSEAKVVYAPSFVAEDGTIGEEGYDGKDYCFIVYDLRPPKWRRLRSFTTKE